MDGLFGLIWVVFIVVTLTNALTGKNKKKQQKRNAVPPFTSTPVSNPARQISLEQLEELLTKQTSASSAPAQTKPAQVKPAQVMPSSRPATPPAVATPKVHTHLSPDCNMDEPSGSMDFLSTEGMDPCHDDDLPSRSTPRSSIPVMREQPGLTLEWTSDALVRSVIMQEVLTRPSQRQRRS